MYPVVLLSFKAGLQCISVNQSVEGYVGNFSEESLLQQSCRCLKNKNNGEFIGLKRKKKLVILCNKHSGNILYHLLALKQAALPAVN